MPVTAVCPKCGSPLSEDSVAALAPVCEYCDAVITEIGGSLGVTDAYGISDPGIEKARLEADLAVLSDYQNKYQGMLQDCEERLNLKADSYAHLPPQPEYLPVQQVPSLWKGVLSGIGMGFVWFFGIMIGGAILSAIVGFAYEPAIAYLFDFYVLLAYLAPIVCFCAKVYPHFKAKAANGKRPQENAIRKQRYEEAVAAAMEEAESIKAKEDYRLRLKIRKAEGMIKTLSKKVEDVRKLMSSL